MKHVLLTLALSLAVVSSFAQEASFNTPVARASEAKLVVSELTITQTQATIVVQVKDASNVDIRSQIYNVPDQARPSATVVGLFTAIDTVRASETGGVLRRANFRILGFLSDNGYLAGVTLVP